MIHRDFLDFLEEPVESVLSDRNYRWTFFVQMKTAPQMWLYAILSVKSRFP